MFDKKKLGCYTAFVKKMYKRSIYTKNDAGNVFFASLMVPQMIGAFLGVILLFVFLLQGQTPDLQDLQKNPYVQIAFILATQGSFLLVFFAYNKLLGFDYFKASKIKKPGILNTVLAIVIGLITLFGFQSLISYFDYVLAWLGKTPSGLPLPLDTPVWFIVNLFLLALLPAVCEELIFRGVILNGLAKYGKKASIIISALLFALIHANIEQTLYPIIFGIVLASIAQKTKSVVPGIIAHFVNNATVITINFLANIGVIALSQTTTFSWIDFAASIIIAAVSAVVICLLVYFMKKENNQQVEIIPPDKIDQQPQDQSMQEYYTVLNDCKALENASGRINNLLWLGVFFGSLFWLFSLI